MIRHFALPALVITMLLSVTIVASGEQRLRLATTTSTDNSGLLERLHPVFEKRSGIKVDVIAVGTGKALRLGAEGDVDLLLVHAPAAEQRFTESGNGIERRAVMHNDFVIVGPPADPAGIKGLKSAAEAVKIIANKQQPFVSRGDDSGTHKKEHELWQRAGLIPSGLWYTAVGQGMGAVLRIADEKRAYTLSDRGTFIAYGDKISLVSLVEGDSALFNPYHLILINPARHPHVNVAAARRYSDFITSSEGQALIAKYQLRGQTLFHPDAIMTRRLSENSDRPQ